MDKSTIDYSQTLECANCHVIFNLDDRLRIQYPGQEPELVERMYSRPLDRAVGPYCRNCMRMLVLAYNMAYYQDPPITAFN